jgi:hypothetical protein
VQGDLANITAPPFFLAPSSVVEVGHCWAQRPDVFAAPALEPSAEKRSLLTLKLVLVAMKSQFYIAATEHIGIRKPLNAFLGELFFASWTDVKKTATTHLVAEQVSHHPPITAMHIVDREHGIRADGYARVEMTFAGSVHVREVGHAVLHIDRFDEDYLIPLPDVNVHGFLTGRIYPDINSNYSIVSSSGYVSEIKFTSAGLFRGKKNSFKARVFHKDDPKKASIYELIGVWSEGWTVTDCRTGEVIETYDATAPENTPAPADVRPIKDQDPWESRRAWAGVIDALERGNFHDTVQEKSKIEQAQRRMRLDEQKHGRKWEPLLFRSIAGEDHEVFHRLAKGTDWKLQAERTKGVWKVDESKLAQTQRPFYADLTPLG